jgi:5-methylthioadenosine/S-adenosylhomocysteine deaminase
VNRFDEGASRRGFLTAGISLAAGAGLTQLSPSEAAAQGGSDAELARVQGARRVLLQGGVVLTLDPQVGGFAQADVLIENGKIREVRPNVAVSDDTAVVDAKNRIIIPGFVDTHSHSYQGLLRNILISGLLNPDYNRDIQTTLTPAYQAADAYAGVLITALGMIEMGTTAVVDISQVSHTPEHSDACIRALQESGIRAVFAYHRGAGPAAQYPQDIKRLQRTYFSSNDQLLTLALTTNLNANVFALAREVGVPVVQHLVGADLSPQLLELGRAGLLRPGDEYIHCLGINDAAWHLIKDSGGQVSICAPIDMAMGHGLPAIQEAHHAEEILRDRHALEGRAREVLAGLGFSQEMMDGDVGTLSGGWKMRVAQFERQQAMLAKEIKFIERARRRRRPGRRATSSPCRR